MLRTLRAALVALALTLGLVAVTAGTANAAPNFTDGFEPPPAAQNWSFSHAGNGAGGFSSLQVHGGVRDAFISIFDDGFSSVERPVFLAFPKHCDASVWVNPGQTAASGSHGFGLVNFEILTADNHYIALRSATLNMTDPYTLLSTSWDNSPTFFRVRISIVGNGPGTQRSAWVDDMSINCVG